jgi:hypothetical protein
MGCMELDDFLVMVVFLIITFSFSKSFLNSALIELKLKFFFFVKIKSITNQLKFNVIAVLLFWVFILV